RNQGNINEAVYMLAKAKNDRKAVETNTHAALAEAVTKLSSAFSETTVLKSDVLPSAQSAFDAASQGYREGKFEYLDVLDAQRTLFEVRGKYIKALAKYHKSRADAERLIGQDLDGVKNLPEAKAEESK
ncbi:MAG: TolC family protein, partial [Planctomycetota bacterium]